jgi:hypothetical protein
MMEPQPQTTPQATPQATPEQKQTAHVFDFSYGPLLLDYGLRWAAFEAWRFGYIPGWLFWVFQLAIIPLPILRWVSVKETKLKDKYGITANPTVQGSLWAVLLCWFVVLSGSFVSYLLYEDWPRWAKWLSAVLAFIFYGWYVLILYISPTGSISKTDRLKQQESIDEALSDDEAEVVDANDVRIVRMETEIGSISQRVESYTLESALFGALSFSGFLTLIASEKDVLGRLQQLLAALIETAREVARIGLSGFDNSALPQITNDHLLAVVAMETLLSSMFFVSVIVSRLRFYNYLRRVDYAVRLARMYNNKEEEIFHLRLQFPEARDSFEHRLTSLTQKVADAIHHAEPLFNDLSFVARYMWGFRNLGIGSFVLILVTSGYLVSPPLGVLFVTVSVLAYLYSFIDSWWRSKKLQHVPFFLALERKIFRIPRTRRRSDTA